MKEPRTGKSINSFDHSKSNKQVNNQAKTQTVSRISVKTNRSKSYEALATVLVNVILSTAAIAGLVRLIPDQAVQISKLQVLEQEVTAREKTVDCLRDEFSQSFDLGATQAASLREKGLISATQRPIRFSDANSPKLSSTKLGCN
jgi:hypothetical protein